MNITDFLLARIAEDEQVARDAAEDRPGSWRVDGPFAATTRSIEWPPAKVTWGTT